jgi:hypothetical protein
MLVRMLDCKNDSKNVRMKVSKNVRMKVSKKELKN